LIPQKRYEKAFRRGSRQAGEKQPNAGNIDDDLTAEQIPLELPLPGIDHLKGGADMLLRPLTQSTGIALIGPDEQI
jgi:hypothetical protein